MKLGPGSACLKKNDHIDFWYVQDLEADRRLLLRAEMKLPGRAWLEFFVSPQPSGRTLVRCFAWFEPRGLLGELYWCGRQVSSSRPSRCSTAIPWPPRLCHLGFDGG